MLSKMKRVKDPRRVSLTPGDPRPRTKSKPLDARAKGNFIDHTGAADAAIVWEIERAGLGLGQII